MDNKYVSYINYLQPIALKYKTISILIYNTSYFLVANALKGTSLLYISVLIAQHYESFQDKWMLIPMKCIKTLKNIEPRQKVCNSTIEKWENNFNYSAETGLVTCMLHVAPKMKYQDATWNLRCGYSRVLPLDVQSKEPILPRFRVNSFKPQNVKTDRINLSKT